MPLHKNLGERSLPRGRPGPCSPIDRLEASCPGSACQPAAKADDFLWGETCPAGRNAASLNDHCHVASQRWEDHTGAFRKRVQHLVECLIGHEIERFGSTTFALIDKRQRADAWFSFDSQLRSIFDKLGIDLAIDVGANEGQFSQDLRSFFFGDIISFEPVTPAFEILERVSSSDKKWHVYNIALGSDDSTQSINVSVATVFSSLLRSNEYCIERFGASSQGISTETVSIRRLDNLLESIVPDIHDRRIFLKMDTQGYDTEVFRGLGDKRDHVFALQSEVSLIPIYEGMTHWTRSISIYEEAGFRVVGMFPVSRDSDRVIEYDCLLVRAEP